ncbi:hypothetical protein HPB51_010068 [Rhipicephalus microplus]|uniref:Uncharacterized protein n=1 Tax=Rhipicephalus microplus TaxID=6941 RepID=A0A9J6F2C6_RHIMP|nr:hypothetical protein HPB51_010068 [Rhipicephalus microplus]
MDHRCLRKERSTFNLFAADEEKRRRLILISRSCIPKLFPDAALSRTSRDPGVRRSVPLGPDRDQHCRQPPLLKSILTQVMLQNLPISDPFHSHPDKDLEDWLEQSERAAKSNHWRARQ